MRNERRTCLNVGYPGSTASAAILLLAPEHDPLLVFCMIIDVPRSDLAPAILMWGLIISGSCSASRRSSREWRVAPSSCELIHRASGTARREEL